MKETQLRFFQLSSDDESSSSLKRRVVSFPLDSFILACIIIFLCLMGSYILGIQRGQLIKQISEVAQEDQGTVLVSNPEPADKEDMPLDSQDPQEAIIEKETTPDIPEQKVPKDSYYCIQVASYLKENIAQREKQYLEKSGFSAALTRKGKYLVVFVKGLSSREEAVKTQGILRKRYADCFIRKNL